MKKPTDDTAIKTFGRAIIQPVEANLCFFCIAWLHLNGVLFLQLKQRARNGALTYRLVALRPHVIACGRRPTYATIVHYDLSIACAQVTEDLHWLWFDKWWEPCSKVGYQLAVPQCCHINGRTLTWQPCCWYDYSHISRHHVLQRLQRLHALKCSPWHLNQPICLVICWVCLIALDVRAQTFLMCALGCFLLARTFGSGKLVLRERPCGKLLFSWTGLQVNIGEIMNIQS